MSDLEIRTDELSQHKAHVAQVASAVDLAKQASYEAGIGGTAFGLLCTPMLLPPLLIMESAARRTMQSATDALERTSRQLGLTTEDFNSQEADLTRGFKAEVNVWGKRGRHE